MADAAAAFGATVGAGPVLKKVVVSDNTVSFTTNIHDEVMAKLRFGQPFTAVFTWDLNGLRRRIGDADTNAMMKIAEPAPFSVDDVDWTILAQLERDALARLAIPKSRITEASIAKSSKQPGRPVLVWTIEIMEPSGEVSSVISDLQGAIQRVVLPASRRPKVEWLDAATIAAAIARIAPTFGHEAKIASIAFDDGRGSFTVDEPDNDNRPATFEFSSDGVTREASSPGGISFLRDPGPRFPAADVAPLNERMIAALEAEALKRLGGGRTPHLQSVKIGANPFVPAVGAHAIEVRVRDTAEDSIRANYAWIVFDFDGRVLDLARF